MSQKRRLERLVKSLAETTPGFEAYDWGVLLRWCSPHYAQSMGFELGRRGQPGVSAVTVGWNFFFDRPFQVSWVQTFRSSDFGLDYDEHWIWLDNSGERAFRQASREFETLFRTKILPLLDRFDSIEKLVAAYDAETDFTPFRVREPPSRFSSQAGLAFGRSMDWRRYNLAHCLAELGRRGEAIEHMEAMLREFPARDGVEWEAARETRAKDWLAKWRAMLAEEE